MKLGLVGLGRMGSNMARRLMKGGHACVVYDVNAEAVQAMQKEGAQGAKDLEDLVRQLPKPAVLWLMLPAGEITERTLVKLVDYLKEGDCLVDGGNSFFKDSIRRASWLGQRGFHFFDAGTSGGVWGLERGYCLMVGGPKEAFALIEPALKTLAPGQGRVEPAPGKQGSSASQGYLYCGPAGAGHFVKMIHNGIEYGLMQAYAEGFEIMQQAASTNLPENQRYALPLADIAELWRRGSVVSSWLLDLSAFALAEDAELKAFSGHVADSGEGRWTVEAAIQEAVPAPVLSAALYTRFRSRQEQSFGEKLLSAMRKQFGGHQEPK